MKSRKKVFGPEFIDQIRKDFDDLLPNQRPSIYYLCTNPEYANDLIYIEEIWCEIISSFKSNEYNEWLKGIRSSDNNQFWSFWFHFQLYGWLKKYGTVHPAPHVKTKNEYHPDFAFSSKGTDFIIEARIFPLQGNDLKIRNLSDTIGNILNNFPSKYWIDFEFHDYSHDCQYNEIRQKDVEFEITGFLYQWTNNNHHDDIRKLVLSNSLIVNFCRVDRGYETNSSWSGELLMKAPIHMKRFITEIEEKMEEFSKPPYIDKNNLIAVQLKNTLETPFDFKLQIFSEKRSDKFQSLLKNIDGFMVFKEYFDDSLKKSGLKGTFLRNKHKRIMYEPKNIFPNIEVVDENGFFS